MQVTHFGHACVLVDLGTARILIDPGEWSEGFSGLRDLSGILITHKHSDHLDARAVAWRGTTRERSWRQIPNRRACSVTWTCR